MSETNTEFHSGFLTLVGRPNADKSTLLNAAVGHKLAITSNVAQTTRRQMRAVVNTDNSQLIIVDTPGLHKPKDALGKELNRATLSALEDVDVIALLIDATQEVGRGDEWVASHVRMANAPHKILLITKADLVDQQTADAQAQAAAQLADFDDVLVVSAKHGFNVKGFIDLASSYLPEGPRWFPEGMDCDLEDEELVAEFVREKAFRNLRQEIPHSLAVSCEDIEWAKDGHGSMVATILVERDGQKGIVIGKSGSMIKKIGTEARRDLERLFGVPIYLDLSVRVQPAWRRDRNEISRLGLVVDE